ncbi:AraC family transcriptional regulator [Paenibacillus sp. WLX1005]|uniref:helix-turn-helix transcriptional regulator n=1 Tax=Paenibacillus sp. WLX1005 TaxID=3243766 RepID=UPI003983EC86
MTAGFEAIPFHGQPVVWTNRHTTTTQGPGFYHWHPCCEMLLIFAGEGTVVINNQTYAMQRGMLFFFQPFEIHNVHSRVSEQMPYERAVIHINHVHMEQALDAFPRRQEWFRRLCREHDIQRVFQLGDQLERLSLYVSDYEQAIATGRAITEEELNVFMLRLLGMLNEHLPLPQDRTVSKRQPLYSEQIMNWIETNYMESDILNRLAQKLHLHRSYVSRIFKKETGSNLSEYLTAKRIKVSAHLLESTTLSVETIGNEVGFHNIPHFISCFKKTYSVTPLQYRLKIDKQLESYPISIPDQHDNL